MPVLTIDQILAPLSPVQARQAIRDVLVALAVPADRWIKGGVASSLLTGAGNILSMLSVQLANGLSSFFLPTAAAQTDSPGLLQMLATYFYGFTVPQATFASCPLTLTNAGGGVYPVSAGSLVVTNSRTGATYVNEDAFTLFGLTSLTIPVQCTVAGKAGNAPPGYIDRLVTPLTAVTCSNPVTAVGLDPPTNARLQQMCLDWLAYRSVRGPRGAYGWAISGTDPKTGAPLATNIVTGAPVNINRWLVSSGSHTGDVLVVITSPTGTVDPNDLAGVVLSIEANVRPEGAAVTVVAATPVPYVASLVVYVRAPPAVTADALESAIADALSAFFAEYPIGGETVSDDGHPGGFTGLTGTAITGAAAVGVATLAGATLLSVMGAPDLAMTGLEVATDTDALSVIVRTIPS